MIRETKKAPQVIPIDLAFQASIHNRFDIEVIDAKTGEVKQKAQAKNVVCDGLWTRLIGYNSYFLYAHYGTGTGTPDETDTALFSFLGAASFSSANNVFNFDWTHGVVSARRKTVLSEITAVGATLTEIGIGYSSSSNSLVTHAMLQDMNGNPISITKTNTDIINIYATIFIHFSLSGYSGGFCKVEPSQGFSQATIWITLLGIDKPYGLQSLRFLYTKGIISNCGGNNSQNFSATTLCDGGYCVTTQPSISFEPSNKRIIITSPRLSVSMGNISGGLKSVVLGYLTDASNRYLFFPFLSFKVGGTGYASTSITGESIGTGDGTTTDFKTSFDFIQNGAKVYVDGIEQVSGLTIDYDKPSDYQHMNLYFELFDSDTNLSSSGSAVPAAAYAFSGYGYVDTGRWAIYYNPNYSYGIKSFRATQNLKVEVSDDLETWTEITNDSNSIPVGLRRFKYWKLSALSNSAHYIYNLVADGITDSNNIHFTTPPAVGAVITANYITNTIAKDENHVFDFSMSIQFGEHAE